MGPLAFAFLLAFVFLIVVVLMSLLNGLAVSDTGAIQAKAEIVGYISRVETISYTESVLLGEESIYCIFYLIRIITRHLDQLFVSKLLIICKSCISLKSASFWEEYNCIK